jgi:hypothetical protein
MIRAGIAAVAAVLVTPGAALAQTAATPCFEFIPARPRIEPPTPMLVDKCTGRTWLLTRASRGAYRWAAIQTEIEQPESDKPKATDRPVTDTGPAGRADKEGGGSKCFTFNNRKFCE